MSYSEITVGDLVAQNPERWRVFDKFGIDFCCGGKMTLEQACTKKDLDLQTIQKEIENLDASQSVPVVDWTGVESPSRIIDFILTYYHDPLRQDMQRLSPLMIKVAQVHGARHRELPLIGVAWTGLCDELTLHLRKEEMILFPMIRRIEEAALSGWPAANLHCGSVENPIHQMEFEHETAGETLARIRELSSDYSVPPEACNSFRALYSGLAKMDVELRRHIHLENNVLHPIAVKLESKTTTGVR